MKVQLKENVPGIGHAGEIREVSPGYARNFLFPKELAVAVTDKILKENEMRRSEQERSERQEIQVQQRLAAKLKQSGVSIAARANEAGQLYGSVGETDIAAALAQQGFSVLAKAIKIDQPFTHLGEYPVTVELRPDSKFIMNLIIKADE